MTFVGLKDVYCEAENCSNWRTDNSCGSSANPEDGTPDDYAIIDSKGMCTHFHNISHYDDFPDGKAPPSEPTGQGSEAKSGGEVEVPHREGEVKKCPKCQSTIQTIEDLISHYKTDGRYPTLVRAMENLKIDIEDAGFT